jgi:hypothetical protein
VSQIEKKLFNLRGVFIVDSFPVREYFVDSRSRDTQRNSVIFPLCKGRSGPRDPVRGLGSRGNGDFLAGIYNRLVTGGIVMQRARGGLS